MSLDRPPTREPLDTSAALQLARTWHVWPGSWPGQTSKTPPLDHYEPTCPGCQIEAAAHQADRLLGAMKEADSLLSAMWSHSEEGRTYQKKLNRNLAYIRASDVLRAAVNEAGGRDKRQESTLPAEPGDKGSPE